MPAGCTPPAPDPYEPAPVIDTEPTVPEAPEIVPTTQERPAIKQTMLMVLDGVRPDTLLEADTPHLDRLAREGSFTWNAWTVWRPITLTAIPSLLTGAPPDIHGVSHWDGAIHAETIPEVLTEAGLTSALVGSGQILGGHWATRATGYYYHPESDAHFADRAIDWIETHQPFFIYLYNPKPDSAGHAYGHASAEYREAIESADRHIGRILSFLEESDRLEHTLLVVTTDHGMTGTAHGYGFETDMRIFSIWRGPGIKANYEMKDETVVPAREPGSVTVRAHPVADHEWVPHEMTWNNQPVAGEFLSDTRIDREGRHTWDVTPWLKTQMVHTRDTDETLVSFALTADATGDQPVHDPNKPNPGLYSDANEAVYFNSTQWPFRGAHPSLVIRYVNEDGTRSEHSFPPIEEAFVVSGNPDAEYVDRHNFHIGYDHRGEGRAFIKFDTGSTRPAGSTVESATLVLHCWRRYPAGYPTTLVSHHIIDIAPTITELLGLRSPRHSTGKVIQQILE